MAERPNPAKTGGRTVRSCPICGKLATKESAPFCSERCRQVDLNRWLSGSYSIPGEPAEDADPPPVAPSDRED